jgi:hypothetical protein
VRFESAGPHRTYDLDAGPLAEVFDWVQYFDAFWRELMGRLEKLLDAQP